MQAPTTQLSDPHAHPRIPRSAHIISPNLEQCMAALELSMAVSLLSMAALLLSRAALLQSRAALLQSRAAQKQSMAAPLRYFRTRERTLPIKLFFFGLGLICCDDLLLHLRRHRFVVA
jgi:hypothetical protein